ncbi:MAG: M56 family metallopeptidase, partial [Verrucomicrobiota bacterium]
MEVKAVLLSGLMQLWCIGAAVLLLRLLSVSVRIRNWVIQSNPITHPESLSVVRSVAEQFKCGSKLDVRLSGHIRSPLAVGLLRRRILLPRDAADWSAERLRIVLLHESAHLKRRDVLRYFLFQLACALHWPNPLVWRLTARYRNESEFDCDHWVIHTGQVPPTDYATTLLELAVAPHGRSPRRFLAAPAMAEANLSTRIERLLTAPAPSAYRLKSLRGWLAVFGIGSALGAVAAVSPRPAPSNLNAEPVAILSAIRSDYATTGVLHPAAGTIEFDLRIQPELPQGRDIVIFHSEDSRFVVLIDHSGPADNRRTRILARAGGNRPVNDNGANMPHYPEVSIAIDNTLAGPRPRPDGRLTWSPLSENRWHRVKVTWSGSPEGEVRIYLNDVLMGCKPYTADYDDGRPFARTMAVGIRPVDWIGRIIR